MAGLKNRKGTQMSNMHGYELRSFIVSIQGRAGSMSRGGDDCRGNYLSFKSLSCSLPMEHDAV